MRSVASVPACAISVSPEWLRLTDAQQLHLARAAMQIAVQSLAEQADVLAREMEEGCLLDRGGPDALRLLARVMRLSSKEFTPPALDLATMEITGQA